MIIIIIIIINIILYNVHVQWMGEMCTCTTEMSRWSSCSGENHLPWWRTSAWERAATLPSDNMGPKPVSLLMRRWNGNVALSASRIPQNFWRSDYRSSTVCLFFLPFEFWGISGYNIIPRNSPGPSSLILQTAHHFTQQNNNQLHYYS